jgi:V/A-type H+-transporting ATPase subunit F
MDVPGGRDGVTDFFVIGDEEIVIGFGFVGVPGVVARSREEALAAFRETTARMGVKVLILTEQVSALIPDEVMNWQMNGSYPLIVELPGIGGHVAGRRSLIDSIREAVGIHV